MSHHVLVERLGPSSAPEYLVRALRGALLKWVNKNKESLLNDFSNFMGRPANEVTDLFDEVIQRDIQDSTRTSVKTNSLVSMILPSGRTFSPEEAFDELNSQVEQIARNHGWFINQVSPPDERKRSKKVGWLFQQKRTEQLPRAQVPEILYHITPIWNVENILRKGLMPNRDGREVTGFATRKFPGRVFLATNRESADELLVAFASGGNEYGDFDNSYVILRVDPREFSRGTKLYIDPEEPTRSVWTPSRIPPSAVSLDPDFQSEYNEFRNDL